LAKSRTTEHSTGHVTVEKNTTKSDDEMTSAYDNVCLHVVPRRPSVSSIAAAAAATAGLASDFDEVCYQ